MASAPPFTPVPETPAPTIPPAPFTPGGDLLATPPPSAAPATSAPATPVPSGAPAGVAVVPQGAVRPKAGFTPGEASGDGVDLICRSGYAGRHRHVDRQQYVDVYGEYGIAYPQPAGTYELDHLIPLELGGDNADANLWPEPASPTPGFHEKDQLETRLHDLVCAGRLDLATAQHAIASDWYSAYHQYVTGGGGQGGGGDGGGGGGD